MMTALLFSTGMPVSLDTLATFFFVSDSSQQLHAVRVIFDNARFFSSMAIVLFCTYKDVL